MSTTNKCPKCGAAWMHNPNCSNYNYYECGTGVYKSTGACAVTAACISRQRDQLLAALTNLMPFVLEDYYPDCAAPDFKAAVETAKELIERLK